MPRRPTPGSRERILETASRLFYENGVRAVGTHLVAAECGIGKQQLYREFASKEELVAAWLHQERSKWWAHTARVIEQHPDRPADQLLEIVEMVRDETTGPTFRGCPFLNTASEFADPNNLARREASEHLVQVRRQLVDLSRAAGARDPELLADALQIIINGMYSSASVLGGDGPASRGVEMARALISAATGTSAERHAT